MLRGIPEFGEKLPAKRSDDENAGVVRVIEIKAYSIVGCHIFVQTLRDTLHERSACGSNQSNLPKLKENEPPFEARLRNIRSEYT